METSSVVLVERIFVLVYGAFGVSLLLHGDRWVKVFAPRWDEPNFAMRLGAIPLVCGAVLVVLHPVWTPDFGSIVTALGWLAMLKGLVSLWRPEWLEALARRIRPTAGMFRARGAIVVILAGLVAWHAFGGG